jgi:phosphatidylglycerophosphatase A
MGLIKLIASWFGIGYIKGGGTIAAAVTCIALWFLWKHRLLHTNLAMIITTLVILLIGIFVGNKVEPEWGKDSYRVVIDEVAGVLVNLLFVPHTLYFLIGGFVLFRFFDMVKPLGIRKAEALPAGTGVMMDDVFAGIYGNVVLQIIIAFTVYLHA